MKKLKPWARGPLELIRHAEEHLKGSSDFDRRMVLVSFDNAIEFSIITFLSLNPLQRNGWQCEKAQAGKWLHNFHSKLEFLEHYVISQLKQEMLVERDELVYYHSIRNELYHNGNGFTPTQEIVEGIREASHWVFSVLFGSQPGDHLASSGVKVQTSLPVEEAGLSSTTLFLQTFIEMKKLLGGEGIASDSVQSHSLINIIQALANLYPIALPEGLIPAAEKAESIRNSIVDGEELASSNLELNTLSSQLKAYSAQIDSSLRAYQLELVQKAIAATTKSIPPYVNRRVGVIHQMMGTGISLSIISFLVRARQISGLERIPFIVVGLNRVFLAQLKQRFIEHCPDHLVLRAVLPRSSSTLLQVLSTSDPGVVFTTLAQLRIHHPAFDGHCLLLGVDLNNVQFDLKKSVPNATFINFTSAPARRKHVVDTNFGDLLASFDLGQAVEFGLVAPIALETRPVTVIRREVEATQLLAIEEISESSRCESIVCSISSDIKDFAKKRCRLIVIANKVSSAFFLRDKLIEILHDPRVQGEPSVNVGLVSSTVEDGGRDAIDVFNCDTAPISVLVITNGMLAGLDLIDVDIAYVTSLLKVELQHKVASLLGLNGVSMARKVVDFTSNEWSELMAHYDPMKLDPNAN
ncbi:hypothetical protein [Pseudomonas sp. GR 6-02]|uniref:hypothetical protein n=1 Tax=Pseudomonas sp. GR 6-02 TaxID=1659194 RepID=UPI0007DD87E2|nr:hypothetical protein [Pseudomonas sp. GR 6-02]ANI59335.1 hypothetical protein PGR6_17620 [Pseudomonas sp. GR 6-02]